MRKTRFFLPAVAVFLLVISCGAGQRNPFFTEHHTPFNVPPFSKIRHEHYMPAFREGIKRQQEEIKKLKLCRMQWHTRFPRRLGEWLLSLSLC